MFETKEQAHAERVDGDKRQVYEVKGPDGMTRFTLAKTASGAVGNAARNAGFSARQADPKPRKPRGPRKTLLEKVAELNEDEKAKVAEIIGAKLNRPASPRRAG